MTRYLALVLPLVLPLLLAACEGDAAKLKRLRTAEVTACVLVVAADSMRAIHAGLAEREAKRVAFMRAYAKDSALDLASPTSAVEDAHDLAILKAEKADIVNHRAVRDSVSQDERTQCDLVTRAVTLFMNGH